MKTFISHSRGVSISVTILAAVAYFLPAPSSAQTPAEPSTFYLGADISSLAGGRGFGGGRGRSIVYQENGQEGTEFAIMAKHGWNAFRLRVFVSPVRMAPNNSLENTLPLAKQIKEAGAAFMLDIHYSDTWADPQHQETPVAWRDLDVAGLEKQVEAYSQDVITQLREAGAMPDMVQVGNEITGGMLWPLGYVKVPPSEVKLDAGRIRGPFPETYDDATQWSNLIRFIKAGVRGVRAGGADKPVQIVMHIDCGGDWPTTKWWFDHLTEAKVDYDVIGQSFYPRWHGTPTLLQQNMLETARRYGKPIMVVETGYPQSSGDQVMASNQYSLWPGTQEGQLQFMVDLVNTVKRTGGTGVFYWAPEGSRGNGMWNPDGTPAPSIFVLDNLTKLMNSPASRLPAAPAR
ncbi:MAG: glycosyl hydrolase 53 family protein [Sedimentisphaerales bacterium]|nr:glycosyl hydrolase 53 family protein [Sedimentisphaerales bacterium]